MNGKDYQTQLRYLWLWQLGRNSIFRGIMFTICCWRILTGKNYCFDVKWTTVKKKILAHTDLWADPEVLNYYWSRIKTCVSKDTGYFELSNGIAIPGYGLVSLYPVVHSGLSIHIYWNPKCLVSCSTLPFSDNITCFPITAPPSILWTEIVSLFDSGRLVMTEWSCDWFDVHYKLRNTQAICFRQEK